MSYLLLPQINPSNASYNSLSFNPPQESQV